MRYHLALGSNLGGVLGPPRAYLKAAAQALCGLGIVGDRSSLWASDPVDAPAGSGRFENAAVAFDCQRPPAALLSALLAIEASLGRVRAARNAPRTIDLDLLLAGDLVIDRPGQPGRPGLVVPHPRLHQRAFVLAPLAEIAPAVQHPLLHRSIETLWHELQAALAASPSPGLGNLQRLDESW